MPSYKSNSLHMPDEKIFIFINKDPILLNALLFPTVIVLKMHFRKFYIVDIFLGFSLTVLLAISHACFDYLFAGYGPIFYVIYPPFALLSIFLLFPMMALYGSSLMVTPFAFQKAMNLNLWCKAEVSDANRNFIAGRF
jgi:hypothetical protein